MAVTAHYVEGASTIYTSNLFQHDKGQRLIIDGIELPAEYDVQFSNDKEGGISVACIGNENGVLIPNAFLITGKYIYAYVAIKHGERGYKTGFTVVIPVIPKPVPLQGIPVPENGTINYEVDEPAENLSFKAISIGQ